MSLWQFTRNWYGRYERPISSLSLILGFVFDILTLKRVDTLWENFWILGHIIIVGVFIVMVHVNESEEGGEKNPEKIHFWYVNILQFFFGGLLSAFLVFYFRSADIFVTWPFLLLLLLAFIANESLKRHYIQLTFQISLFFLSIYSFAIFLVPVLVHRIGADVFIISGLLSLLFIFIFNRILFYFVRDKFQKSRAMISFVVLGIFLFVNFLYFTNLIPPIPLSLKDGGIYHSIEKNQDGNYDITYEDRGWRGYFELYPDFRETSSAPVYAYSAVFSPKDLNLTIVHEWQYYDETQNKWITGSLINLSVLGGRDGGFRTYSMRSNLAPGKWRVNIKTEQGLVISRLRFNIVTVDSEPVLTTETK